MNVEVISPDGQAGTIPQENLAEALRDGGFKQAARVVSPEGISGSLPLENLDEALKNGFKLQSDTPGYNPKPDSTPLPFKPWSV